MTRLIPSSPPRVAVFGADGGGATCTFRLGVAQTLPATVIANLRTDQAGAVSAGSSAAVAVCRHD